MLMFHGPRPLLLRVAESLRRRETNAPVLVGDECGEPFIDHAIEQGCCEGRRAALLEQQVVQLVRHGEPDVADRIRHRQPKNVQHHPPVSEAPQVRPAGPVGDEPLAAGAPAGELLHAQSRVRNESAEIRD